MNTCPNINRKSRWCGLFICSSLGFNFPRTLRLDLIFGRRPCPSYPSARFLFLLNSLPNSKLESPLGTHVRHCVYGNDLRLLCLKSYPANNNRRWLQRNWNNISIARYPNRPVQSRRVDVHARSFGRILKPLVLIKVAFTEWHRTTM